MFFNESMRKVCMKLSHVKAGQKFMIEKINDKSIRDQAVRLGLFTGAQLICSHKLPGGPLVLKLGMIEIAVSRKIAKNIEISIV